SMINRAGMTFCQSLSENLRVPVRDVVAAYTVVRDAFELRSIWDMTEAQTELTVETQAHVYATVTRFLERVSAWLLRNLPLPLDMGALAQELGGEVQLLMREQKSFFTKAMTQSAAARQTSLVERGIAMKLAQQIGYLDILL